MRAACALLLALGCSASDPAGAPDARLAPDAEIVDPSLLRVGGQYTTAVSLRESTCASQTVQDMPTSVSHVPGATTLTLTHGGTAFSGTVEQDGNFSTVPLPIAGAGETHTVTISGRFSLRGFTASVSVDVSSDGAPVCSYLVRWIGSKVGADNVIPG